MADVVAASGMHPAYQNACNGQRVQSSDCCGCLTLRRSRKQPLAPSTQYIDGKLPADELIPIIKQFGDGGCLQWSTMQEGVYHFLLPDVGFIAYTKMKQPALANVLVLGDPICHTNRWSVLVDAFTSVHKQAVFAQISREFGIFLSQHLGYYVNCFGGETELSVSNYNYSGGCKKSLRLAAAKCKRAGITVEEMQRPSPRLAINLTVAQQLRLVSQEWLATKTTYASKSWFLLRHPLFENELPGTRTFVAWSPADITPGTGTPNSQSLAANFTDITADQAFASSNPSIASASSQYPLSAQISHSDSLSVHSLLSSDSHHTQASTGRQAIGFVVLDPMYSNGQLIGYYANIVRTSADAPSGTAGLLIQAVLKKLRAEEQCSTSSSNASSTSSMKPKRLTRKQRARLGAPAGSNREPDVQACVHTEIDNDMGQVFTTNTHVAPDNNSCAFPYSTKLHPIKTLSKQLSCQTQSSGMVLSLGLSAMCCIKEDKQAFKHVPWVHQVFKWLWNNPKLTAPFYPFHGVAAAKAHYAGSLSGLLQSGKYSDPAVSRKYNLRLQETGECHVVFVQFKPGETQDLLTSANTAWKARV